MKKLSKEAKNVITEVLESIGEISLENAMALVEPHYMFDPVKAKQSEVRKVTRSLISQIRDDGGVRKCFLIKDEEGETKAVNVDKNNNLEELHLVSSHLTKQAEGLYASIRKVRRREQEVIGQMKLEEII